MAKHLAKLGSPSSTRRAAGLLALACALFVAPTHAWAGNGSAAPDASKQHCRYGEASPGAGCEIFVSLQGRDNWRGNSAKPFKTVERAQEAVRELRSRSARVTVTLEEGTHRLQQTLALTEADSGEPGTPVVWRAAPGTAPTLSGGRPITGWKMWNAAKNIYRAPAAGVDTRQLYVNGRRATRASTPALNPGDFVKTETGFTVSGAAADALSNVETLPADLEVIAEGNWRTLRCGVANMAPLNGANEPPKFALTVEQPCWHNANIIRPGNFAGSNIHPPRAVDNALGLLDSPSEWFLDKNADWLYYKPRSDENLSARGDTQVVAPELETLVLGEGTLANPVHDIEFRGLTFADATWLDPNAAAGYAVDQTGFRFQPNQDTPSTWAHEEHLVRSPGNVRFKYAHRIGFTRNHFTRLGSVGLDFDTGSQENYVVRNRFDDISLTGIQLGGIEPEDHHPTDARQVTRDNLIADNTIQNIGVEYFDGPGIFVGYTKRSNIEHNELRNLPYSGITVGYGFALTDQGGTTVWNERSTDLPNMGWTLYDTPTTAEGNRVVGNRITNYMRELVDGGGIYTLGWQGTSMQNGMLIEGNVITEPHGPYFMMYMDVGTRFVTVRRNVQYAIGSSSFTPPSFFQHSTGGCAPWGDILYDGNYWFAPTGPTFFCGGAAPDRVIRNVELVNNQTISSLAAAPQDIVHAAGPR